MRPSVTARAPGKINVFFRAGPARPDGYHDVASLYLAVSLYEDVTATARDDDGVTVRLSADSTAVRDPEDFPLDADNLVVRAAKLLAAHTGAGRGVDLEVVKRVPIAGGMGGGSADAAATLVACNALWGTSLTREQLCELGSELGADVPFAITGGAAVGLGIGDELSPLLLRDRSDWVVLPASYGLSTPAVFKQLDALRADEAVETPRQVDADVVQALVAGDHERLPRLVHNDLARAAISLAPELGDVLEESLRAGALAAIVSGSGPTAALLAEDAHHADQLALQLQDEPGLAAHPVHGPVPGAGLI
ncbi:4-(cytidine 5'-diphospho)-2-C-methyl-D-erythritol kinase [Zhihengliuella salsuginis]|uniref:4-diphosphocytidyl-2-C-methyl-D-erythritol kinase n=1 Tax=Zhihengliuella salsuginis TaxID=578222 RepID=A0ABQ3GKW5_9MICC|nr:4-(cytidine 5'-diphospho)-2-C-methyl-D-erythritol kinase [Zhihengliuella salsuginis]GHD09751.1 4-diphosphocytidyl-2-C-methyl-D-erythritol kinase [Zhihengliuella salsuginis]